MFELLEDGFRDVSVFFVSQDAAGVDLGYFPVQVEPQNVEVLLN